jgi:hypothetical protein
VALLAEFFRDARESDLEVETLGTANAEEIASQLTAFATSHLAPILHGLFYRRGVGMVVGLRLVDGREIVVKLHRWRASFGRLTAVQEVQDHLARVGLPVPIPLVPPTQLGRGIATVEELRLGSPADGHRSDVRRALAAGLRRFVVEALPLRGLAGLGPAVFLAPRTDALWPEPHDLRFDFNATAGGAEWIDELAVAAHQRLANLDGEPVVGHLDWRVENLAFDEAGKIAAIYDWDSVALAPEPYVAGHNAAVFSADWQRGGGLPSLLETVEFVREYELARGRPFDAAEREMLDAAHLLHCAYGARCQHSDTLLGTIDGASFEGGWIALLRERAGHALEW